MSQSRRSFLKDASGVALMAAVIPASFTLVSSKQKPDKMIEKALKVVAIAETSADKADELKSICLGLIEPTRKESGCISYELYQDQDNRGKFVFIETWQSREHLDNHLKTPHLVAGGEAMGKIVTKDLIVMMLDNLA
jgi:quinol monooxygenase YgiN